MCKSQRWVFCRSIALMVVLGTCVLPASSILAQAVGLPFAVGPDSPDSENSRQPFQLRLSGVLNPTTPPADSVAVVTVTVGTYRETYQFEVRTVEAPDYPHMSTDQVLRSLSNYGVQMHLIGPKEVLSKIGQSHPGTPLTVVGFFIRRSRQLQVLSVDVFSLAGYP